MAVSGVPLWGRSWWPTYLSTYSSGLKKPFFPQCSPLEFHCTALAGACLGCVQMCLRDLDSGLGRAQDISAFWLTPIMQKRFSSSTLWAHFSVVATLFQCISWINPLQFTQEIMTGRNKSWRGLWAETLPVADSCWLSLWHFLFLCCQVQKALELILPNERQTRTHTHSVPIPILLPQASFQSLLESSSYEGFNSIMLFFSTKM